jgi:hypothetical protein
MEYFILIFILLFIAVLILGCSWGLFKKWCAKQFDSDRFKSFRLVITLFGIVGAILGYSNWYYDANMKIKDNISFELPDYYKKFIDAKENQELTYQYMAENDIIYNPFFMCFHKGWQPVITEVDKNYNAKLTVFGEDEGKMLTKEELDRILQPNKSTANISDFYLPPKARFSLKRQVERGHHVSIINISSSDINLTLEVSTSFKNSICNVKVTYVKNWIFRIFRDNFDYDNWHRIICDRLKHKQRLSQRINQKNATSATGGISMFGSMLGGN